MKVPHAVGQRKCPASQFATQREDDEVLALDDATRDHGHQHLLGMGHELLATGYLGP